MRPVNIDCAKVEAAGAALSDHSLLTDFAVIPGLAPLLLLLAAPPAVAPPASEATDTNVALGKSYTLSPKPNYPLTTDPADAVQLTDGKHAGGGFWTDKAAVGWVGARVVTITIDLGATFEVSGASFSTAAGRSDVEWPSSVIVMGSVDGRSYELFGDLVALDAEAGRAPARASFEPHVFWSKSLAGTARFVRFMVGGSGPYVFADEVEVFGKASAGPALQAPPGASSDATALFWRAQTASLLRGEVLRRIAEVRERLASPGVSPAHRARAMIESEALRSQVTNLRVDDWETARRQYPVNAQHAAALAAIGAVEAALGAPALRAWPVVPWDPFEMTASPSKTSPAALEVTLMNGEARSAALALRNSTARPLDVDVDLRAVDGLQRGWVQGREVAWTGDRGGRPVASVLLSPSPSPTTTSLTIPGGVSSLVWITFSPRRLPPGVHTAAVRISSLDKPDLSVPVRINILPLTASPVPSLHLAGWDYLDDHPGSAPGTLLDETAALLRSYGVDVAWGTASVMPFGTFRSDGKLVTEPSTIAFDAWIARWKGAARYRVYLAAGDDLAGVRRGTPAFAAAVREWSGFWAAHAKTLGVDPGRLELLFVDEPRGPTAAAERQIAWARALNAGGSGLRVWLDPVYPNPADTPVELVDSADTLCLDRRILEYSGNPYFLFARQVRSKGRELELYGADGPASALDPYSYYRLMAWRAFEIGASGIGFWSFGDSGGGTAWREYLAPRTIYSTLFSDEASVLPTRQLQAIREGIQDVAYLARLRALIDDRSRSKLRDEARLNTARALLESTVARVLETGGFRHYSWDVFKDRTLADSSRMEIAKEIQALENVAAR